VLGTGRYTSKYTKKCCTRKMQLARSFNESWKWIACQDQRKLRAMKIQEERIRQIYGIALSKLQQNT